MTKLVSGLTICSNPKAFIRSARCVSILLLGLGLSNLWGCASPPTTTNQTSANSSPKSTSITADNTQKKPGGYYQEDGPQAQMPPETDLLATPDAVPLAEEIPNKHFNRPYVVMGKTYTPLTHRESFQEEGIASWYGKQFHGKRTSSGEPYNMYTMTAAHPTLPIPSYVRVTNLSNQRQVIVKVNDRGPFHRGRIIDLSYTAALKLGYVNQGSTKVKIERILGNELISAKQNVQQSNQNTNQKPIAELNTNTVVSTSNNTPPTSISASQPPIVMGSVISNKLPILASSLDPDTQPKPKASFENTPSTGEPQENNQKRYFLQLANFSTADAASRMVEEYRAKIGTVLSVLKESGFHKVVAGPFNDETATRAKQKQMRQSGFSSFLLVR
jgi:rare lipoprotein A